VVEVREEGLTVLATVSVTALAEVIRSEEAANREKGNMQLPILRKTLEQSRVHQER